MADVQQFVDRRKVPALAFLAAPLECREIVPREVVLGNVGRDFLHIHTAVGTVVRTDDAQVGLAELAPVQVNLIERDYQPVLAVVGEHAYDALDPVLVIEFADLVLLDHILHPTDRAGGRRLGRSGSGGNRCRLFGREGRGQRCCRNARGSPEILFLAVCILDITDFRHGQDISRAVGIGETLVADGLGGNLRHFRFDLRGVGLDYQVLGCDSQYAAKRCQQQQDRFFHHCRKCI